MPKLVLFLPCERVIVNPEDNNPTLVTVLSEIAVPASSRPDQLPRIARGVITRWQILTTWLREPEDERREFEQSVELIMPDGETASDPARVIFKMVKRSHRNTTTVVGFPISKTPGECLLKLSLRSREDGMEEWGSWQEAATYPILLKFED